MRIWTIHPKYLDVKGLVALWRETLLAQNAMLGNTKGWANHPQLSPFKKVDDVSSYLLTNHLRFISEDDFCKPSGFCYEKELLKLKEIQTIVDLSGHLDLESHLRFIAESNKRESYNEKELLQIKSMQRIMNVSRYLANYLHLVCDEGESRGYDFVRTKVLFPYKTELPKLKTKKKVLEDEWKVCLGRYVTRSPKWYEKVRGINTVESHPIFVAVN